MYQNSCQLVTHCRGVPVILSGMAHEPPYVLKNSAIYPQPDGLSGTGRLEKTSSKVWGKPVGNGYICPRSSQCVNRKSKLLPP